MRLKSLRELEGDHAHRQSFLLSGLLAVRVLAALEDVDQMARKGDRGAVRNDDSIEAEL